MIINNGELRLAYQYSSIFSFFFFMIFKIFNTPREIMWICIISENCYLLISRALYYKELISIADMYIRDRRSQLEIHLRTCDWFGSIATLCKTGYIKDYEMLHHIYYNGLLSTLYILLWALIKWKCVIYCWSMSNWPIYTCKDTLHYHIRRF